MGLHQWTQKNREQLHQKVERQHMQKGLHTPGQVKRQKKPVNLVDVQNNKTNNFLLQQLSFWDSCWNMKILKKIRRGIAIFLWNTAAFLIRLSTHIYTDATVVRGRAGRIKDRTTIELTNPIEAPFRSGDKILILKR